jgi:Ras-related protein Rab-2A
MATNYTQKYNYLFKYIIIGSTGVGKSQIVQRFITDIFHEKYGATIGAEFGEKNIEIEDKIIRIQIWDTAGQERFRSITTAYYKNCVCAIIVYDITCKDSFKDITNWINDCKNNSPKTVLMALIGNKCDLKENRAVSTEEGQELAEKNGISFYETSAKDGTNIKEIFQKTGEKIYQNIKEGYYNLEDLECGIKSSLFERESLSVKLKKENVKEKKKCRC